MPWHRNCQPVIKAVRTARLGNWKMDHSTSREFICTKCRVQIDGRAIAVSATECMCSDCWQLFLQKLFPPRVLANRNEASQSADV